MAQKALSDEECQRALDAWHNAPRDAEKRTIAASLGLKNMAFHRRLNEAKERNLVPRPKGYTVHKPPSDLPPVSDLVEARKRAFERKKAHEEASKLIRVDVHDDLPIGILHFGDPHVDDDGTDIAQLEAHALLTRNTAGLYAANVGDTTNNWVGRLARLYGEQSTSAREAWLLCEWFLKLTQWLYIIGGNHDCWSGAADPINWIARQQDALYTPSEARLGLHFPNGRRVIVNARHDFPGHSQWNPAHGAMKAAQMGCRDNILVCGHKHVSGYGLLKDAESGSLSHCIQVASYKIYDRYAKEKGFRDQNVSPCAVTIIDAKAKDETGLIQTFWNAELAADYLTFLRKR